jgi:hypothetical protein
VSFYVIVYYISLLGYRAPIDFYSRNIIWDNIANEILKLFGGAKWTIFKFIWLSKIIKMMCDILKGSIYFNSQLMDYMVSLHFIDFVSWGVLDNGPLYCITLWLTVMACRYSCWWTQWADGLIFCQKFIYKGHFKSHYFFMGSKFVQK